MNNGYNLYLEKAKFYRKFAMEHKVTIIFDRKNCQDGHVLNGEEKCSIKNFLVRERLKHSCEVNELNI
jgi:hypothetical protein